MINRQVNLDNLSNEQISDTASAISDKIVKEVDDLINKSNMLLKRYGLSCKMQIIVEPISANEES